MNTLGMTHSVCEICLAIVPAKVVEKDGDVFFEKFCVRHGSSVARVRADADDYLRTLGYVKPAWIPRESAGNQSATCPDGCGFCTRHEQHLCMPIVEITSRCDLNCPVCLVDAGRPWDMTQAELVRILDALLAAERQVDVLNFSGGEPLMHPELIALVDEALRRPEIVRVSVSTNGLALLARPELLNRLRERNVVVSLQFDGFRDEIYEALRGKALLAEKLRLLDLLRQSGVSTSLTMTAAGGVNDDQFPAVLDYFFAQPHVVSLMIQPLSFAGRARHVGQVGNLSHHEQVGNLSRITRLTIPQIVRLLAEAGRPEVRAEDFQPLPCSHPLCFSLAYYLVVDGGRSVSLSQLIEAPRWLDAVANRTIFGLDEEEHQRIKDMIYDLWSGPAATAPDSAAVMQTLRGLLDEMTCDRFDCRRAFLSAERRVKSIFIHAFQDAETFDLARVRRCCHAYPQPDGRLMPACVHNVLGRKKSPLRAATEGRLGES
jgi:7,8-dihydro-6-hydroxymethylpterin dimethyltransferase